MQAELTKKINSVNELINQRLTYAKSVVYNIIENSFKDL